METQNDPGPGTGPAFPPGIESRGDKYLYSEIQKVGTHVHEIVKAVSSLPAEIDAKIEPLNGRLAALGQAIESLSKLSENVEKIRDEFTGFRGFRERIEGREKLIEGSIKKFAGWAIGGVIGGVVAVAGTAYYVGSTMGAINANVAEMKTSVSDMKGSIDKLEKVTYDLNGTMKGQDERLKHLGDQLKAAQDSMQGVAAKTAAETSDRASERISAVLDVFEKRIGKDNASLAEKLDAIERRVEETSDVLVLWLTLAPGDKPISRSETALSYYLPVPAEQRQKVLRAIRSKTLLEGAVNVFDGEALLRPPGVAATAQPMKEDGRVPIQFFFQDKSALEGFEKLLNPLPETRKSLRLKITFTLG